MGIEIQDFECGCSRMGRVFQTEKFDWKLCKKHEKELLIKIEEWRSDSDEIHVGIFNLGFNNNEKKIEEVKENNDINEKKIEEVKENNMLDVGEYLDLIQNTSEDEDDPDLIKFESEDDDLDIIKKLCWVLRNHDVKEIL